MDVVGFFGLLFFLSASVIKINLIMFSNVIMFLSAKYIIFT